MKIGQADVINAPRSWVVPALKPLGWALAGAVAALLLSATIVSKLNRSENAASLASRTIALQQPFVSVGAFPSPQAPSAAGARDDVTATIRENTEAQETTEGKAADSEPMIARTASLTLTVKDFMSMEAAVKTIMQHYHGYIGELSTSSPQNAARTLTATVRIPSAQLEAALAELKQLGRVEQVSQSGEEVTKQYTDLAARLKNSRSTEQRLLDVLRKNTGKVKDILEVENELSRVRGEIEQMEADQRALRTRVDFASVQLSIIEDFKATLQVTPPSTPTRLHNALVAGYRDLAENLISLTAWLLESGPTLLVWTAVLFFPARWAWKRLLRTKWATKPVVTGAA
jgi:hypothetical protein